MAFSNPLWKHFMYCFVLPGGGRRREEGEGWGGGGGEQIRRYKVPSLPYFLVVISFPGLRLTPRIALCLFSSCRRLELKQSSRFQCEFGDEEWNPWTIWMKELFWVSTVSGVGGLDICEENRLCTDGRFFVWIGPSHNFSIIFVNPFNTQSSFHPRTLAKSW